MDDYIISMRKLSHRENMLTEGLRVVHAQGFAGTSVRDIVQAAGAPQGSFTNHFVSKERFGLEVLELYFAGTQELLAETLLNDSLPPLVRLRNYIALNREHLNADGMRNGCLYGNFTAEVVDQSELIRGRLVEIFAEVQRSIAYCLDAAVISGAIARPLDTLKVGGFIIGALQGAILLSKARRDAGPIDDFEELLFETVLR